MNDAGSNWPVGNGEMATRIRAFDWSTTPLGSLSAWPQTLKAAVDALLGAGHAMQLVWGPEHTVLYNDAYVPVLGERHPDALGMPVHAVWPDRRKESAADAMSRRRTEGTEAALRESEARLNTVLEGVGEAFYALDSDWRFLFASRFALQTWGKRAEEVLGRAFLDCFPEAENSVPYDAHSRVMKTGMPERLETISPVLSRWLEIDLTRSDIGGVSVAFRDIHARKLAEMALREREAELAQTQQIGQVASVDVIMTDPPTGIRSLEYRRLHGLSLEDASETHDHWLARLHPEDRDEQDRIFWAAIEHGDSYETEYRIIRPSDGAERWIGAKAVIERDAAGKATRLRGAHIDITERKRADAALRESEARFSQFAAASSDVLWVVNAETGSVEYLSPAFDKMWGVSRDAVKSDLSRWADTLHPDDRAKALTALPRALAGNAVTQDYRIVRADGSIRYITDVGFPIFDGGRVVRVGGIAQDLTDRRQAEQAVQASERRLRALVEGVPQLVWRALDDGNWTWASPQWTDYTGQQEADSHGWGWLDPVHPDDRQLAAQCWADAVRTGEFSVDYRIRRASDGRYRWFQTCATPVRDEVGRIVEWLGTSTDIDDLRQLKDRQQLLLAELQHRVRNILTVVRSVFSRTMESGGPIDEIADHFRGRLDSLARTQVVVTQSATGSVDLENLIRDELLSVGVGDGPDIMIEGPEVGLDAKAAESIGLAIHELTTNALKYGALKTSGGRLDIGWSVKMGYRGKRQLSFTWSEQGVPTISLNPTRKGFGTELITQALPYRLGGETTLQFRGGGVCCTLSVPLPDEDDTGPPLVWKDVQYGD